MQVIQDLEMYHRERIDEVAIDGVQRTGVVVSRGTDGCQIDRLRTFPSQDKKYETKSEGGADIDLIEGKEM